MDHKDNGRHQGLKCTLQEDGALSEIISAIRGSPRVQGAHHGWVQSGVGIVRRRGLFSLLPLRFAEPMLPEPTSKNDSRGFGQVVFG